MSDILVKPATDVTAHEVDMEGAADVTMRMLIGPGEGAPNFAMRMFEISPGGHTPLHTHPWEHETFILEGSGALRDGEADRPISAGDCVFIPADELHQFAAAGDEMLKILCLVPADSACGLAKDDD